MIQTTILVLLLPLHFQQVALFSAEHKIQKKNENFILRKLPSVFSKITLKTKFQFYQFQGLKKSRTTRKSYLDFPYTCLLVGYAVRRFPYPRLQKQQHKVETLKRGGTESACST